MWALGIIAAGCKSQSQPTVNPQDARAAAPPEPAPLASQPVTWTCTGTPCPWGPKQTNHAVVWPTSTKALAIRLGYTTSAAIYLPAAQADGAEVSVESGVATVHAGRPGEATHRLLATLKAGESLRVSGIKSGEVVSVQGDAAFTYRVALKKPPQRQPGTVVSSIGARWQCNKVPGCTGDPWPGAVITWPEWSAKQSNGRTGNASVSRSVVSDAGEKLYPYMGAWAEGCDVTAEEGMVQIIEWKYGAETWRSTILLPGDSHVIHLVPPENGALIEADDGVTSFSVSLRDCTPQRIRRDGKR